VRRRVAPRQGRLAWLLVVCALATACGARHYAGEQGRVVDVVRAATSATNPRICDSYTPTIAYADPNDGEQTKREACTRATNLLFFWALNVLDVKVGAERAEVTVYTGWSDGAVFGLRRVPGSWRIDRMSGLPKTG